MEFTRTGSAEWHGGIKDGKGTISTESGALAGYPYGFKSRFEGQQGSNPEELIGAAHAACFSMALSLVLGEAHFVANWIKTTAAVTIAERDGGYLITCISLTVNAEIPGVEKDLFDRLVGQAKDSCPVSKLVNAGILLDATLSKPNGSSHR
jgi:osmotically inducible protein OsmC